jgi:hypothetical protein
MPAVKNVGEPCAGEPHARIEVAAGGNQASRALPHGAGASRRPYLELGSRRVQIAGCTSNPTGTWVAQQARNLSFSTLLERTRFLIHDRSSYVKPRMRCPPKARSGAASCCRLGAGVLSARLWFRSGAASAASSRFTTSVL